MAVQKAQATGTAAVMDWFDRNATSPYYSVLEIISPTKKELLFSSNEDSLDNARVILEENISAFEQNGVNTLYALVLHPNKDKSGYITQSSPSHAMLKFRASEIDQNIYGVPMQQMDSRNGSVKGWQMDRILEKLDALETRIAEAENSDIQETDKSPIGQMLANPQVQQALVSGLLGIAGNIFGNKTQQPMAGIGEITEEAVQILDSLLKKGVSIDHLRKLNAMSDTKLNSLLIML